LRKIVALILLAIFLFNIVGAYLFLIIRQNINDEDIKAEMRKNLRDEELTLITIPNCELKQIHWIKPGAEFVYNNMMFDVFRTKSSANQTMFYCIHDKKEKQIINDYQKHTEKANQSHKIFQKVLSSNLICTTYTFSLRLPVNLHLFKPDVNHYFSIFSDTIIPPPERKVSV
jgi:hypothetical protein